MVSHVLWMRLLSNEDISRRIRLSEQGTIVLPIVVLMHVPVLVIGPIWQLRYEPDNKPFCAQAMTSDWRTNIIFAFSFQMQVLTKLHI